MFSKEISEEKKTEFLEAAEKGNAEKLSELLSQNPSLAQAKQDNGLTAMHLGAQGGYLDVVKLLAGHIDFNQKDDGGFTPLCWALWNEFYNIVEFLLAQEEVDISSVSCTDDDSPLLMPIGSGELEITKLLVSKGISIGGEIFHCAIVSENEEITKVLLENCADVNAQDEDGDTVLHIAVRENKISILELLIQKKDLNPRLKNKDGQTPLLLAQKLYKEDSTPQREKILEILQNPALLPGSRIKRAQTLKRNRDNGATGACPEDLSFKKSCQGISSLSDSSNLTDNPELSLSTSSSTLLEQFSGIIHQQGQGSETSPAQEEQMSEAQGKEEESGNEEEKGPHLAEFS